MLTNIYFVRHGKAHNPSNIFYGRLPNINLSKEGREQIEQSAAFLKDKHIIKIFSSPLLRSKQSAKIVSSSLQLHRISESKLINEINSFMEGLPFSSGKSTRFDHYFSPSRKEGNETFEAIAKRMIKFVATVKKQHPNQNVAVISHGDPLMILKTYVNKLPMTLDSIRPNDGTYIEYGEIFLLKINNDQLLIEKVFTPKK